jgi:3-oxoacyl-[acyl-carrier-protein] synthase-1
MKPVYIIGSSLMSALENPADISSSKITPIELTILNKKHVFPYYTINEPNIDTGIGRMYQITHKVVAKAITDANLTAEQLQETALFLGSTSFSIFISEQKYSQELLSNPDASPIGLTAYEELTNYIKEQFMPKANSFTYHTACTSSVNALLHASKMIDTGKIKHALVVGLEFFNETTLLGFHSLDLISKTKVKPFGIDRDGIILGEACSAIVLSADKPNHAQPVYIKGGATMVDLDSMTTVKPDGSSIVKVINNALIHAQTNIEDISAIKLHGTASYANDNAEAIGLNILFKNSLPPTVALKPCIGHTLGACGTNELIIFCEYLKGSILPPLPYQYAFDESLGIHISDSDIKIENGTFLLNHFGFGGNNSALIISNVAN